MNFLIKVILIAQVSLLANASPMQTDTDLGKVSITESDQKAVEKKIPAIAKRKKLHELRKNFDDGVKEYRIQIDAQRIASDIQGFTSQENANLHMDYCSADSVLIASVMNAKSFLSKDEADIFTKTEFRVEKVIKTEDENLPKTVSVIANGGEVVDKGETLRVTVEDAPQYLRAKTFLLFLPRIEKVDHGTFLGSAIGFEIRNQKVFPADKNFSDILPGTPLEVVLNTLQEFSTEKPCANYSHE